MRKTELTNELLVLYTNSANTGTLSICLPVISDADEESMKSLSFLVELACLVHSVKPENVRFATNSNFETKVTLSASLLRLVDNIKASAKSSTGEYNGPLVMFTGTKYVTTPVGILASMRLLQTKDHLLRKRGGKTITLTYHQLMQRFNDVLGIKSEESKTYPVKLLKGILASCVKAHNLGFPGGWIHKNREINKVKTDAGLIQLLGWTEKIVSPYKLNEVLFNAVDVSYGMVDGRQTIIGHSLQNLSREGRNMSFQEFRTAVLLTLPRMDLDNKVDFDKHSKLEPLDFKDPDVADRFCTTQMINVVDSVSQAFAFRVNIKNPKSKTTLAHYANVRGRLLNSTAGVKLVDRKGKEYESFSKIPEAAQNFLRKKYRYPIKRTIDDATAGGESSASHEAVAPGSENLVSMEVDGDGQSSSVGLKRQKTVKISKGTATELRASLARKAKKGKK
jgi:hypothetical protein